MSYSLLSLYEQQFQSGDDQLTKEAAAHGMTPSQYQEALLEKKAQQELQEKQAAENQRAYGLLVADGIKMGIENRLAKYASASGSIQEAKNLTSVFCE